MKLEKVGRQPHDLPEISSNKLLLLLSDTFKLPGTLVRWDYYRKQPQVPLNVCVWRKIEDQKYQLIDYNELTPGVIDFQTREIDDNEQIEVQSGDIIGVFYSRYCISGAIATASDAKSAGKDALNEVVEVDLYEEDLSPGDVVDLTSVPHRFHNMAVALQANIKVAEEKVWSADFRSNYF